MAKRIRKICTTEQALAAAHALFEGSLQQRFAVLADKAAPQEARRAAAEFTAQQYVPLRVAMDERALTPEQNVLLVKGLWNATNAAPMHSKAEGLNSVMWEHALSGVLQHNQKAGVQALRTAMRDPSLKKRSTLARSVANHMHLFGMMWRPEHWGATPANATRCFNRTATHLKTRLHPQGRHVAELTEIKQRLATWRHEQKAALA